MSGGFPNPSRVARLAQKLPLKSAARSVIYTHVHLPAGHRSRTKTFFHFVDLPHVSRKNNLRDLSPLHQMTCQNFNALIPLLSIAKGVVNNRNNTLKNKIFLGAPPSDRRNLLHRFQSALRDAQNVLHRYNHKCNRPSSISGNALATQSRIWLGWYRVLKWLAMTSSLRNLLRRSSRSSRCM